ncbi:hypothetical protein L1987_24711 [Smallanthus sonchifolius]|uniref:Uncharacterized protein n=1 Tax=Smallanthus sonchifolius TaxID=185202 RepID=A0ACB9IMN3_9ASTR|nr:hypothetical protein L1987_24711 [Smallanthus sonchifolius]
MIGCEFINLIPTVAVVIVYSALIDSSLKKKKMTGLGYYGSSSLSNLSPLAPPFTVVRSNHNKPVVNSNLVSDFNDPPYSHSTAGQEFFGDSPANNPAIDHWSCFNPSSKRVDDSLFYNFDEAKPFHRPYASLVKNEDIPLVSFSETSSDLFSTSALVYSGETDYTRNLSVLEYNPNPNPNPKKEGILSRLSLTEEKSAGKMVKDGSFFLGEANTAASFAYNSYMNQGAYGTESLSKGKDDHSVLHYADIIRRANNNGKSDGTSSFANNHSRLDSNEFPKGDSHFRAFPVLSESHSSLIQSPEDPFWNSQKLNPPYEKTYHHMFEDLKSTTKSSPIVIKSPAAAVTASSASSKSLEIGNAAGVLKISDVAAGSSHKILKEKDELHLPQLSFQIGTTDASPFSIKDTKLSPSSDQLNFEFKAKPSVLQLPDINIPDAANSLDHHNPAEDSPCWKGTPFLPFGSAEAQPSTKKLQKGTNFQGTDYSYNIHSSDGKTSLSPIPFHSDFGDVDSLKVRDGGDDANSQIPKLNLTNPEEAVLLLAEMYGEAVDIKVNASVLVKAISNLSGLLLRACSNEALKEHDHEVLDHVTRNLGVCMSRHVQVAAASTNKLMSTHSNISQESQVMNETSGTLQDGEQHAQHQKMKSDVCGESVKNLLEHASPRDLDPPKGDNMVQAIKKVLDENLECEMELPSETTLLYKKLWLETEAELCCLSYRARLERLKRETQKEKPHKSTDTGDASAIKETSRSCNGSTFLKADNIKTSNAQHIDDAVNVHGWQNPVKKGHIADVKVTGSGVTMQHQLCKDDGDSGVDSLVMARFNILKNREESNAIDLEEMGACGEERESRFQVQEAAAAVGSGSDWEHILKDEFTWR